MEGAGSEVSDSFQAREGRIAGVGLAEPEKSAFVPVHVAAITDQRCAAPLTRTARTAREQRRVGRIEIALPIRDRLIKIGARVIEHIARIRIHLPTSCPERVLFRQIALRLIPAVP